MITKHISRYFSIFIPYDNRSRGRTPEKKKKKKDRFFYQEVPKDYGRGTGNALGTEPTPIGRTERPGRTFGPNRPLAALDLLRMS